MYEIQVTGGKTICS